MTSGREPHPAARTSLMRVVALSREVIASDLRSVYAMGSSGYGGYVPGWSDLDVDVIVAETAQHADVVSFNAKMRQRVIALGYTDVDVRCYRASSLSEPMSFEYGAANRAAMIHDSAALLFGEDLRPVIRRPDLATLRTEGIGLAQRLVRQSEDWWSTRPLDDTAALLALPGRLLRRRGAVLA